MSVEIPDTGLAGVFADHLVQRIVAYADLVRRQPVRLDLLRDQVAARDYEFVPLGVARQFDDFHSIQQRRRNRRQGVRGGDEEHVRQIEGDFDVVVTKGMVLLGVEDLEQCRGRVTAKIATELVDLVEQEDWIAGAGASQALDDPARHGADIGAPVAADFRFVANAA